MHYYYVNVRHGCHAGMDVQSILRSIGLREHSWCLVGRLHCAWPGGCQGEAEGVWYRAMFGSPDPPLGRIRFVGAQGRCRHRPPIICACACRKCRSEFAAARLLVPVLSLFVLRDMVLSVAVCRGAKLIEFVRLAGSSVNMPSEI